MVAASQVSNATPSFEIDAKGCKGKTPRMPVYQCSATYSYQGYAKLCLFIPVLGLHGVKDKCALLACLASRMCAEPVVGEHGIWCAVLQSVLEQLYLDASTLQTQCTA